MPPERADQPHRVPFGPANAPGMSGAPHTEQDTFLA